MVSLQKVKPLTKEFLNSIGFGWHTDPDGKDYISDELIEVTVEEADAYYNATNILYDMYTQAAQYVVDNNLFHEIGIPFNLIDIVKASWENDVHWHIYGRFDLAGGIDGKPIKLIEFNADTPTSLFETAIIQWAILKYNKMDETLQFNSVYEAIRDNFKRLIVLHGDIEDFSNYYEGWKILFSSIDSNIEEENTTHLLREMANEAGFNTDFAYMHEVGFNEEEGIFKGDELFEFWFKLIPWESIAIEEPDLALILQKIIKNKCAIILNPAYTLIFQSKAILPILWKLFPNHPLLLECQDKPLNGKSYVKKHAFGREGANVSIYDKNGNIIKSNKGEYDHFPAVYQEYVELQVDAVGNSYQAGVFFAHEACGLGFRRGEKILDNHASFVGHIIKE